MKVQPYLFFNGSCEQALEFYKQALGAEIVVMMRFKDAPDQSMVKPENHDKVMHAEMRIGESTVLASDGFCSGSLNFDGFALTILAKDDAEADRLFGALSEGGTVQMALTETFFASRFGTVADKFGVTWMVLSPK